jgi:AraC family transcriptional regulator, regulatory protein of adaptative response / methylated-DNA-[protein]-cysteine methyltransferase
MKWFEANELNQYNHKSDGSFVVRNNDYWKAVETRDSSCDGKFVFAVRSTGIYCRPSCPAKRARRPQVLFFPLPDAAELAGFRPCRRCRPEKAETSNPQLDAVRHSCRWIESHLDDTLRLEVLGEKVGMSPFHLQRSFKRIMGISPRQYAEAFRLRHFKKRLKLGDSVTNAMYNAGYGSSSRLYERASSQLGMTPAIYRNGGRGVRIYYAISKSPIGRILVAASDRGICSVRLGDSIEALKSAFLKEYPEAEITKSKQSVKRWTDMILKYLQGQHPDLSLPLDIQATAFQQRVWEALRNIPYGTTQSYSEIAKAIGHPRAARAVASACAANPVALVVPCHRVIREDKTLGGYRWGIQRKAALLKQELVNRKR